MKISFTQYSKQSRYLEKAIGKTVQLENDAGETIEVLVETIAHNFTHPDKAEINGAYLIDYFDLFEQVEEDGDMTDEDWDRLKKEFAELPEEAQRALLGYDNRLTKFKK